MRVKDYPIKNKKGIFPIILFGYVPFLAVVGTVMAIRNYLNRDKISIVPKALVNDRISLGSGLLWGFLILGWAILFTLAYSESEHDNSDLLLLMVYVLPLMVTGVFLLLQWSEYTRYHKIYDLILSYIDGRRTISKSDIIILTYKYDYLQKCFEDLRRNEIISYTEDEHNLYIDIRTENNMKSHAWTCSGCAAANNKTIPMSRSFECEYCGRAVNINKKERGEV